MTKPPNIDGAEFGVLGVPSLLQCYRHQCSMLVEELDEAYAEVRAAKVNVRKLVRMNDALSKQLAVLKVEHEKVRWQLSDMNLKSGLEAGRRLVPGNNVHTGYGRKE